MDRRTFLSSSTAAMAFCGQQPGRALAAGHETIALKTAGDLIGLEIGTAVTLPVMRDPKASAEIRRHAHLIVPEFALKEQWLQANGNVRAKGLHGIVRSHDDLGMYGHTLHFEGKTPLNGKDPLVFASLEEKKAHYTARFKELIAEYPEVDSWEVTNEDHRNYEEGERQDNIFKAPNLRAEETLEFLAHCMKTARDLAPGKILVINENNLYCGWSMCRNKREDVLTTLRYLKAQDCLPDAVGLQSHLTSQARIDALVASGLVLEPAGASQAPRPDFLSVDTSPFEGVKAFIDTVTGEEFGKKVHITELDVDNSRFTGTVDEVDTYHAAYVEAYLTAVLANPNVTRLTFWGLHDHPGQWRLKEYCGEPEDPEKPKSEGLKSCSRPTLFDANWNPKPVFHRALAVIQKSPQRKT